MNPNKIVLVYELARELPMHKSNLSKLIDKLEIKKISVRSPEKNNQLVSAITEEDAEAVRKYRSDFEIIEHANEGVFYILQLLPEIDSLRVKLGFAQDLNDRISYFRTLLPELVVLKTWKCDKNLEKTVIRMAITSECEQVGIEVYRVTSVENTVTRLDKIFDMLNE